MKKLYGIKTKQIVSNKGTADEIPVVTKNENEETSEAVTEESEQESVQTEITTAAPAESTSAKATAPAQIVLPTDDPSYSLPAITGQTLNGVYVEGDTGYGMYFFNQ